MVEEEGESLRVLMDEIKRRGGKLNPKDLPSTILHCKSQTLFFAQFLYHSRQSFETLAPVFFTGIPQRICFTAISTLKYC